MTDKFFQWVERGTFANTFRSAEAADDYARRRMAERLREQQQQIVALSAPNPALAEWIAGLPETGFWRDAGHGVEQWVVPR